jgi:hypothetical protein
MVAAFVSVAQGSVQGQSELRRFRNGFYDCLTRWPDALFEAVDGLCCPVPVDGVAHLSVASSARRGHGSLYAALAEGAIDVDLLRDVLAAARPVSWTPDFAIDATTWPRCDAECSPGRGFYYCASRHSAGQPIVAGWCYQVVVGLSQTSDSWTAPVDARRHTVGENLNSVAVAQIRGLLPRLAGLRTVALFAFDAGYDPVQLTVGLTDRHAQIVVRIRDDRVFYRPAPTARRDGRPGRRPRHGDRFSCKDPATHPAPDLGYECDDDQYGHVQVAAWHRLHPKQDTYRDPDGAMTIVEGTVIRLNVSRLPGRRDRAPKTLWLWWAGPADSTLDLNRVWRAYIRRFDIEHTFRFAKQSLGWTTPKFHTPEQADRWTWLILAALTQLRLARDHVIDHPQRWQRPLPPGKRTPGRVRAGFGYLLPRIGTPASWPKLTKPGPGRPKGRKSTPATRHPAMKKTQVKPPQS